MSEHDRNSPCPCGSGKRFKHCCGVFSAQGNTFPADSRQQVFSAENSAPGIGVEAQRLEKGDTGEAQRVYQLGCALRARGQIGQAVTQFERAVLLQPDFPQIYRDLGLAYAQQGKTEQAIVQFKQALSCNPDYFEAYNDLGLAYVKLNQMDQAIAHYKAALSINPGYVVAHNNLALAYARQDRVDEAVEHAERALSLAPDFAPAHHNLGHLLSLQGRIDEAIAHYGRAMYLRPNIRSHCNLLLMSNYTSNGNPDAIFAAHRAFARRWEAPLTASMPTAANDRTPERRLRIGYVSSDFKRHSVIYFIEPVLEHHDHNRFEVFCYSNNQQEDEVTERVRSYADHWRNIVELSDERVAEQIRADRIDILIDLNGHTRGKRLLVFARRPAPVQVTWLGYPNTTGLSAMNYRITDAFADPCGMTEHLHSETLVRLPQCFSCYEPPRHAPEVSALPARDKGYVTFGSFNNLAKVTREVMVLWARILQAIPGARLILKNPGLSSNTAQRKVQETFMGLGVASERLELLGRDYSHEAHLKRYHHIDIGLDPFPYNGTTTTCDALWMGVPVITLAGKVHAGRVGVSLLSNVGLPELIAPTPEKYLAIAVNLATDLVRLDGLRGQLREHLAASPVTDERQFVHHLEQAYREMWRKWCIDCGR